MVPRVRAPLSMNFMFPVPEASLLAVEICSLHPPPQNQLCIGYPVILDKYHLDFAADGRVIIDHIRHGVDQLDGQFSLITGSALAPKIKVLGYHIHIRIILQLVIQIHHMKDVHQLALILMKPLYLYVKDGPGIHFDPVVLLMYLARRTLFWYLIFMNSCWLFSSSA